MAPRGERKAIRTGHGRTNLPGRAFRALSELLVIVLVFASVPAGAFIKATITVNGNVNDWSGVFTDAENVLSDAAGDSPLGLNRDIDQAAITWDSTNLYLLFRRASATGGASYRFQAYIDADGDGLMENGNLPGVKDRVVWFDMTGSDSVASVGAARYIPAAPGGDVVASDGKLMPGSLGAVVPGAILSGMVDPTQLNLESSINWQSLGIAPDSPIRVKYGIGQTNGTIIDVTGVLTLFRRSVTIAPTRDVEGSPDTTVTLQHTVTNTGNATETYTLAATPALGWPTAISDGTGPITGVQLPAGASVDVYCQVRVPANTPPGTMETIRVSAINSVDASVRSDVVDRIYTGPLLVIPMQSGTMAASETITYLSSVRNNSIYAQSVDITATSNSQWKTEVFSADGVTPVSSATLAPGQVLPVVLKVSVPAGTPVGTLDTTFLRASLVDDPVIFGEAENITTVHEAIEVTPNRYQYAGEGTYTYLRHTVKNSLPTTQTVTLSAASARGWQTTIFGPDATTPLPSVVLAPNGSTTDLIVRLSVPTGTAASTTDTITVQGTAGTSSGTATDVVTIARLATFESAGYAVAREDFSVGSTVYARAMGFQRNTTITFRWVDPSGNIVYTDTRTTDIQGTVGSSYPLGPNATVGTWQVQVVQGGVVTETTPFRVGVNAEIVALSASDAVNANTTVTVSADLYNKGVSALTNSVIDYLVWRDANNNSTFDLGDFYLTTGSATATYTGGPTPVSYTRADVTLGANSIFTDAWSIPSVRLLPMGMWTVDLNWKTSGGFTIDTRSTTFYAASAQLSLTVTPGSIDFGDVHPEDYGMVPISVSVNSPGSYDLTTSHVSQETLGITTTLGSKVAQAAGQTTFADTVSIDVPWTSSGAKESHVIYTVVLR